MGDVVVISYRDSVPEGFVLIETTSRSSDWGKGLSPFIVGPIELYDGYRAKNMENAWQYSKVYAQHVGTDGMPTLDYFVWASLGWGKSRADRYPMGKGVTPEFSYWDGEKLDYITARNKIYLPLYAGAVAKTDAWRRLKELYDSGANIALKDFDAYDHRVLGMSYEDVFHCSSRKAGHAFILAAMLEGEYIVPDSGVEARLVIFGGRDFGDYATLKSTIEATTLFKSGTIVEIISGKAPGADRLGEKFAAEHGIPVKPFPADWENLDAHGAVIRTRKDGSQYNARAGMDRNEDMADYCTHGVGFWDGESTGTGGMRQYMLKIGRPLVIRYSDGSLELDGKKLEKGAPVKSSGVAYQVDELGYMDPMPY